MESKEQLAVDYYNFLIAKFMGYTYPNHENDVWEISKLELHNYHEDWNLLIPVVEKIENMGYNVSISLFSCIICDPGKLLEPNEQALLIEAHCESKIEAVLEAVIAFIKDSTTLQTPTK
jgi:hypothetical protein